ncbi:MAG TPA: phosphatidylglycerophosphatase A [Rhodopila sp.]|nr:phosphatidylglycerophosphatase A [Rhodopila sp.]
MMLSRFVASGFGTGYASLVPGTVGSAAAALIGALLLWVSPWLLVLAIVVASIGGHEAVRRAVTQGDPTWVVIDEFAGQWVTLLALPKPSVAGVLAAFVLFRIFDITKLGPIGWADRQHGAFGIMADDVIAGVVAALVLVAIRFIWPATLSWM